MTVVFLSFFSLSAVLDVDEVDLDEIGFVGPLECPVSPVSNTTYKMWVLTSVPRLRCGGTLVPGNVDPSFHSLGAAGVPGGGEVYAVLTTLGPGTGTMIGG